MRFSANDHRFMAEALRLAQRGRLTADPNPAVGCVIVAGDEPVGRGWHRSAGEPHAETLALQQAGERARGSSVYVTLEPCSHQGRTPPCVEALVDAGVAEVITAMTDPDPRVSGAGHARLARTGIRVRSGLMEAEPVSSIPDSSAAMNAGGRGCASSWPSALTGGLPARMASHAGSLRRRHAPMFSIGERGHPAS